jgi:hypothetical protein
MHASWIQRYAFRSWAYHERTLTATELSREGVRRVGLSQPSIRIVKMTATLL